MLVMVKHVLKNCHMCMSVSVTSHSTVWLQFHWNRHAIICFIFYAPQHYSNQANYWKFCCNTGNLRKKMHFQNKHTSNKFCILCQLKITIKSNKVCKIQQIRWCYKIKQCRNQLNSHWIWLQITNNWSFILDYFWF